MTDEKKSTPRPVSAPGRVAREGVFVAGSQVLTVVVYAIGFRFLTEAYLPKTLGEATLLIGLVNVTFALTLHPLLATHLRFYPDYRERGLSSWFNRAVRKTVFRVVAAIVIIGTIGAGIWSAFSGIEKLVVSSILLVSIAGQTAFVFESDVLSAMRRQGRLAPLRVLRVFAYPAIAVGIASLASASLVSLLIATAASFWLPFALVKLLGWNPETADTEVASETESREFWKAATLYGAPFFVIAVATWVSSVGDRYILAVYLDTRDVGIYAAIYGLFTQPFLMVAGSLSQWLRPILFDAVAENRTELAAKVLLRWVSAGVGCSLLGGAVLWFTQEIWFDLLLAKAYHYEGRLVLYLIIANTMHVATHALTHHLLAAKKTSAQLFPLAAAAIVNIGCNFIFIPLWGIDGAGLATATSFTLHFLLTLIAVSRTSLSEGAINSRADSCSDDTEADKADKADKADEADEADDTEADKTDSTPNETE